MSCWSCNFGCDPYKTDGVLRMLWKEFGAIPVLPFDSRLSVFSVLTKEPEGGFRVIGDVASLCSGDVDQAKKQQLNSQISSGGDLHKTGNTLTATNYDFSFVLELLAADLLDLGAVQAQIQRIENRGLLAEDVRHKSLPPTALNELMDNWWPDLKNPDLIWKRGKTEIWVVDLVVEVKSLRVVDYKKITTKMGLSIPAVGSKFKLGPELQGQCVKIFEGSGAHQPVAFRGRKYVYDKSGQMLNSKLTTLQPDGPNSETSAMVEDPDDPSASEMAPFVKDSWFATIRS